MQQRTQLSQLKVGNSQRGDILITQMIFREGQIDSIICGLTVIGSYTLYYMQVLHTVRAELYDDSEVYLVRDMLYPYCFRLSMFLFCCQLLGSTIDLKQSCVNNLKKYTFESNIYTVLAANIQSMQHESCNYFLSSLCYIIQCRILVF